MKLTSVKRLLLAAIVLACGTMGSFDWSIQNSSSVHFLRGDFTISVSTAVGAEASANLCA
jgi:hypothetical protein